MDELHVYTDGEEYVIAKDEADAEAVYRATGCTPDADTEWEECDDDSPFTVTDETALTKTFGEWARERGRGWFAASL